MGTDARPCPSAGGGLITFKNSVVAELLQPLPIVLLAQAAALSAAGLARDCREVSTRRSHYTP